MLFVDNTIKARKMHIERYYIKSILIVCIAPKVESSVVAERRRRKISLAPFMPCYAEIMMRMCAMQYLSMKIMPCHAKYYLFCLISSAEHA